jgi:ABC-2 type transport system permease protein
MNKIVAVMHREYVGRVKSKGFLVSTLLAPVVMTAIILLPGLLATMSTGEQWTLSVVDHTGQIFSPLQEALSDTLNNGQPAFLLRDIPVMPDRWETTKASLNDQVAERSLSAYLVIGPQVLSTGEVQLYAANVGDFTTLKRIESALDRIVVELRLNKEGLDPERIGQLTRGIDMKTLKVSRAGAEESGFGQMFQTTFLFVFFLYMTILLYGVTVMRGIIEEKSSRIVEILLSSLNPTQLMAGKIFGVGCVGLTQYLIWTTFGLVLIGAGAAYLGPEEIIGTIHPMTFLYFILFYLLGYFLYATLYAGIGAICTTEQEAQQSQFPVIALLILPLLLITMIIKNPDGTASTVLSLIPFFAPMLMFLRINVTAPSTAQILGSIALLVVTILTMIWAVARIFRVGILMYGKKPSLPEVLRWVKKR